ncbi:hypothetical protein D3C86_2149560 [compost metagenome]
MQRKLLQKKQPKKKLKLRQWKKLPLRWKRRLLQKKLLLQRKKAPLQRKHLKVKRNNDYDHFEL